MAVACGDAHTAFVSEDGESVYTSGCGEHGRLGLGDEAPQHRPARLGGAAFGASRVVMLSAGSLHSAAVTHDGALFTWGHGRHGKLGHGDRQGRLLPTRIAQAIFGGRSVVMTACGAAHTLILTEDGMVYSCGNAEFGQLGHGDERALSAFKQLDGERFCGQVIEMVAAGGLHSAAVSARGDVWTWGRGIAGQLGLGDTRRRLVPNVVAMTKFGGSPVLVVSCGLHFTAAVTDEGAVWSWGKGVAGQLGLGDRENRLEPTRIWRGAAGLGGSRVNLVSCGFDHALAVDRNGNVWSWGSGGSGELGHDDMADREVPTRVAATRFAGKVSTVAAGGAHSAAVTEDGAIYTWGASLNYAQAPAGLGHGDQVDRHVPCRITQDAGGAVLERVGRWRHHALDPSLALAFAMGAHPRLGPACMSALCAELVQQIVLACRRSCRPEGRAGELPGLSLMLGKGVVSNPR